MRIDFIAPFLMLTSSLMADSYVNLSVTNAWSVHTALNGGAFYQEISDIGTSEGITVAYGNTLSNSLRSEISYSYHGRFEVNSQTMYMDTNFNKGDAIGSYKGNVDSHNFMLSLYKDFNFNSSFGAYIGIGAGISRNRSDSIDATIIGEYFGTPAGNDLLSYQMPGETIYRFSKQIMIGATYVITEAVSCNFGYKYLDAGDFGTQSGNVIATALKEDGTNISTGNYIVAVPSSRGELKAHEISIGISYHF